MSEGVERGVLSDLSRSSMEQHAVTAAALADTWRAADPTLAVPTEDALVRQELRSRGLPVTLFGEREHERRQRLISVHVEAERQDSDDVEVADSDKMEEDEHEDETFYTEGSEELKKTRLGIAEWSLHHASSRCGGETIKKDITVDWQSLSVDAAQVADSRPLSAVSILPHGRHVVTGSFGGSVRMWNVTSECTPVDGTHVMRGHRSRVTDVCASREGGMVAASGMDGSVFVWKCGCDGTPAAALRVSDDVRMSGVVFHPSNNWVLAGSDDCTWSMWDIVTGQSVMKQDGHSAAVRAMAMQSDGALVVSGDVCGVVRVWDLRTGKSIIEYREHVLKVTALSCGWGYVLLSGSEDGTMRVWDLRKNDEYNRCVIPAHVSAVSSVKCVEGSSGYTAVSTSLDGTCRVWDLVHRGRLLALVNAHEGKVMDADVVATDNNCVIATAGYDRLLKLYLTS